MEGRLMGIMDRLRSLFGGDGNATDDGGDAPEAETTDEDLAIEAVEADVVQSRDDAFGRLAGMPSSWEDQLH
jgi:hypothetical protein